MGYGFGVDYLAEVLRFMRNSDFSDKYQEYFTLGSSISTRDRDGIHKTFSGLMKIMYPTGEASREQIEELLRFSIEGRKRVKDQFLRIDPTFEGVDFGYTDTAGGWHPVTTLEEEEYPGYYWSRGSGATSAGEGGASEDGLARGDGRSLGDGGGATSSSFDTPSSAGTPQSPILPSASTLFEGHRDFIENQRGVSYETLLLPYLRGATVIELHDPYVRMGHQGRNLVELLALIAAAKDPADEVTFRLFTTLEDDPNYQVKQLQMLQSIVQGAAQQGLRVEVAKDPGGHDRWISTDTGWRINLGRGLDIFQKSDGGWFDLGTSRQEFRQVKAFGVTYIREG